MPPHRRKPSSRLRERNIRKKDASRHKTLPDESPYSGQDIQSGKIRLLTVVSTESKLELSTKPHEVTDDLDFDAISYVWGTAAASVETTCNGKPFLVTPTAHEMLVHLHLHRPAPHRPLWIDAICINQNNEEEKAIQIPFMRHIYSRATQVIIWMGPATMETDAFLAGFSRVSKIAKEMISANANPFHAQDWPKRINAFWRGLYQLVGNNWVRRLWTFQEAVLARKAILFCGASHTDLDEFLDFVVEGRFGQTPYIPEIKDSKSLQDGKIRWNEFITIQYRRHNVIGGVKRVLTVDSPIMLHRLRNRRVEEQVDRIWAVAGLFEEDLQNELAPKIDYSFEARTEYWRTFIHFAKIYVAITGSLILLYVPPSTRPKNDSIPSWVPDFSGQSACGLLIVDLWNVPTTHPDQGLSLLLSGDEDDKTQCAARRFAVKNHSQRYISISATDNLLRVRGFCVDTISTVMEDTRLLGETDFKMDSDWSTYTAQNPSYLAAMIWLSRSLELARHALSGADEGSSSNIPWEYLATIFMDTGSSNKQRLHMSTQHQF